MSLAVRRIDLLFWQGVPIARGTLPVDRSEEHTSELQSHTTISPNNSNSWNNSPNNSSNSPNNSNNSNNSPNNSNKGAGQRPTQTPKTYQQVATVTPLHTLSKGMQDVISQLCTPVNSEKTRAPYVSRFSHHVIFDEKGVLMFPGFLGRDM